MDGRGRVAGAFFIALGLAAGGWLAGRGLVAARLTDRYVTVKGISEREVRADLAIWPIRVVTADNDLAAAQSRLAENLKKVREFLTAHGVDASKAELQRLEVTDANANPYGDANRVKYRYVVRQTLVVRSDKPDAIAEVAQKAGELVSAGIVLSSEDEGYGSGGPRFIFTKLNDVKPPMIEEATARARESAAKFAQDSKSRLGGIRQGNQGVFEILPRDQGPGAQETAQIAKLVRVVTTVEYFLKD
jgi:uncharacterized protein